MDRFLVHRDPGSLPGKVIGPAAHEAANKRAPERAALRSMTHAHLGVGAHRGIGRPTAQFLAATKLIEQLLRWPTQRPDSLENCPDSHSSNYFRQPLSLRGAHLQINSSRQKVSLSQVTAVTVNNRAIRPTDSWTSGVAPRVL
jgi:hypothetical protein